MDNLIVDQGSSLYEDFAALARSARIVCFAGLPGTGKSLMIHQLAHLAHASGRSIHLLQWDIARPPFEAGEAGRRYPQQKGFTHGLIRIAVGRWARDAVARWHAQQLAGAHLLIGETPFVGHRLIELARPAQDAAETILTADSTRFVIPVPSVEVRRHLEAERERRARRPLHRREQEDAPPDVLRDLWRQLVAVARALNMADAALPPGGDVPYDPLLYERVYSHLLRHRHTQVLRLTAVLAASSLSPYDFVVPHHDLVPTADEVTRYIHDAEAAYPDRERLAREVDQWYA